MLYHSYAATTSLTRASLATASITAATLRTALPWLAFSPTARRLAAARETLSGLHLTHHRQDFALDGVTEEVVDRTPFADLLRFRTAGSDRRPPVIVIAPLSGHFATLVRDTIDSLLADHDVYVTDWRNARDIPIGEGRFGLDEYVDHLIRFVRRFDAEAHLLALCQSCVPALVATAVMAAAGEEARPASITLMAGPIDTRVSPTTVNTFAGSKPIRWFERHLIATVPWPHAGAGRRVYPGFVQVSAFVSMNAARHRRAHRDIYAALAQGRRDDVGRAREFYGEYFAVLDLTAEFYLQTVQRVFQRHDLPLGRWTHHGKAVDLAAITQTPLLTVEGEADDICGVGQTLAAHRLCSGLADTARRHHLQPGAGHYGVFSGRRWRHEILPVVVDHMTAAGRRSGLVAS